MNLNKEYELKRYNLSPTAYVIGLKDDELTVVDKFLFLLEITNNDKDLIANIKTNKLVEVKHIVNSSYSIDMKLSLIDLIYEEGFNGTSTTGDYYRNAYTPGNTEQLVLHTKVLSKYLNKLISANYERNYGEFWFIGEILSLDQIFKDISDSCTSLPKEDLAPLMLMSHIFDHSNVVNTNPHLIHRVKKQNILLGAIERISEYLFGEQRQFVLDTASVLNLKNDINYWHSAVNTEKPEIISNDPGVTF